MKIARLALALVLFPGPSIAIAAGGTYTTSRGAVFRQVQVSGRFGTGWKDPDGLVWGSYLGQLTHAALSPDLGLLATDTPAMRACAEIGGRIPTLREYQRLIAHFELDEYRHLTDRGRAELYALFPDMEDKPWFWTRNLVPDCPDQFAYVFRGDDGDALEHPMCYRFVGFRPVELSVRCVTD